MPPRSRLPERCPQCLITREQFHQKHKANTGKYAKHCNLCLGQGLNSRHVQNKCLLCEEILPSDDALYKHYSRRHEQLVTRDNTVRDIHRAFCPEDYPDLDLNQHYGALMTRQNVLRSEVDIRLATYAKLYKETPALIYHEVRDIKEAFREAFSAFFKVDPISLHGHVSDAANPDLLGGLISHVMDSSTETEYKHWTRRPTCIAAMEGVYGAGYGPLAYNAAVPKFNSVASGIPAIMIQMECTTIYAQLKAAKDKNCIAFMIEMVRSQDGAPMAAEVWREVVKACQKLKIVLVVDEALTAVRCGAPFAHQLPDYQTYGRPDLILFGKGIRTNGVAIDWDGVNIGRYGITSFEERVDIILRWQARFTEIASPDALLQSWGTLTLAQRQNWPQRGVEIGQNLRDVLVQAGVNKASISGLHALIYLRRNDSTITQFVVMPAGTGSHHVRWLPTMDTVMTSPEELDAKVFGLGSASHRRDLGAYLAEHQWSLGICPVCGEPMETGEDRDGARKGCPVCLLRPCEGCEPGPHICLLRTNKGMHDCSEGSPAL